jgi:hypothetical protein
MKASAGPPMMFGAAAAAGVWLDRVGAELASIISSPIPPRWVLDTALMGTGARGLSARNAAGARSDFVLTGARR